MSVLRTVPVLFVALAACPKAAPPAPAPVPVAAGIRIGALKYDASAHTLYVEAGLEGTSLAERKDPVFLGVTAVTPEGTEIDLMVNELFPGALDQPVVFYAEVGVPVRDVLIGAWNTKIQPCEVDRYGCKQFGFVLDGPVASWPPGLYTEGVRQRIPPAAFRVRVEGDAKAAGKAVARELAPVLAPFGSAVSLVPSENVPNPGAVQVRYADDHDLYLARLVVEAVHRELGVAPELVKAPLGDDAIAVAIGVR